MNINRTPNMSAIDLNLLRVFDAIMQEGGIRKAADKLGMSQPAASHALGRLRHALKDDLFVRSSRGMLPTPRAIQLAHPVRSALHQLELSLQDKPFEPASAQVKWTVALDNYCVVTFTQALVASVTSLAPGVKLDIRPSGTLDIDRLLDDGEVDVCIGRRGEEREEYHSKKLFDDDFVVVQGPHSPARVPGPLTMQALAERPHIHLSSTGDDTSFIDEWLQKSGLMRNICHSVPLLGCKAFLHLQDALLIVRRRMAQDLCLDPALTAHDLPFECPRVDTYLRWHRRFEQLPAHAWLRDRIDCAARSLVA